MALLPTALTALSPGAVAVLAPRTHDAADVGCELGLEMCLAAAQDAPAEPAAVAPPTRSTADAGASRWWRRWSGAARR